jgi:N-methylhydantoinase A/oxoprolinase/acetone carboxylase beta subunit
MGGSGCRKGRGVRSPRPTRITGAPRPRARLPAAGALFILFAMRIGIDVGGTNTDAVVVDGGRILAAAKIPTSEDVTTGITGALQEVLKSAQLTAASIRTVMLGTTHFTNAMVERKRLAPVGVIRLALPASTGVLPMTDWPEGLRAVVGEHIAMVDGGYEADGRLISPLREPQIRAAAERFGQQGVAAIAISCVNAFVNPEMELRAAQIVREVLPFCRITVSSEIGTIGLVERENAAIMNAALSDLSNRFVTSFRLALNRIGLDAAPFFISQNDGTLMSADRVARYPVLTFASGPTNSMRGAALLTGLKEAIVVDIGGTTTDVGVLTKGFPRESAVAAHVGGVRTNFRMPDVLSVGLGGGSLVRILADGRVRVGPDSVGFRIRQEALVFGGRTLTATDIVVAAGHATVGDPELVRALEPAMVEAALSEIHRIIEEAIDRMKISAAPVPVVLVGGGGILVTRSLAGASELVVPESFAVANALGAAAAQVAGSVDRLFSYSKTTREAALQEASREAIARAIEGGAAENSVDMLDLEELPLAYIPGNMVRIRAKAVGNLAEPGVSS